ncbi:MAG TPA: hypothetical protein VF110_16625 [Burkholderiales bacterium]
MFRFLAAVAAFAASLAAHASCGAAFCVVNTGFSATGVWTDPGTRLDLRFEYIDQDQPLFGKDKVSVGQIPRHHNEVRTINRNLIGSLDHSFGANWGVNVTLPVVDRSHEHIHQHMGQALFETWDFTALGDVRVVGRYQFDPRQDGDTHTVWGINFGLKLPTGKTDEANAEGLVAERSLQPGSGSTDGIIGVYYSRNLPMRGVSWFAQAAYQDALKEKDDYRPGDRFMFDVGLRYEGGGSLATMLQLNYLNRGKDSGRNADQPDDTGGNFIFLSPGASWNFTKALQLYGFVQVPIYQKVNGVQLVADYAFVVGLSTRF